MMKSRRTFLQLLGSLLAFPFIPVRESKADELARWECTYNECDPYIYDPKIGDEDNLNGDHPIPAGVAFEDLPDDWICPFCGSPKDSFIKLET